MTDMLSLYKNLERSFDTYHSDEGWQECVCSFCDEGVRLPHIGFTIACIDHAACLYLLLVTFSTSLFVRAIACEGRQEDNGPMHPMA